MDDACRVRFRKAVSNLSQVAQELPRIRFPVVDESTQRLAIDELHRYEVCAITFANFIDVRDVRMIQRRRGLSLLYEPAHSILISSDLTGQDFERHSTSQLRIFGQIHLTHTTFADL